MAYYATTQRGFLGTLLAILLIGLIVSSFYHELWSYTIFISVVMILFLFVKFKFEITESSLKYAVYIWRIPIFQSVIDAEKISQLKFKRIGWTKKAVVIQTKIGINIYVNHFSSNKVFLRLVSFANENCIPVTKTEGFLLLEQMTKNTHLQNIRS